MTTHGENVEIAWGLGMTPYCGIVEMCGFPVGKGKSKNNHGSFGPLTPFRLRRDGAPDSRAFRMTIQWESVEICADFQDNNAWGERSDLRAAVRMTTHGRALRCASGL
jgi:hypothetical protein